MVDWAGKKEEKKIWLEAKGREGVSHGCLRLCHSGSGGSAYLSGIASAAGTVLVYCLRNTVDSSFFSLFFLFFFPSSCPLLVQIFHL
jgi:hypothetical protein